MSLHVLLIESDCIFRVLCPVSIRLKSITSWIREFSLSAFCLISMMYLRMKESVFS